MLCDPLGHYLVTAAASSETGWRVLYRRCLIGNWLTSIVSLPPHWKPAGEYCIAAASSETGWRVLYHRCLIGNRLASIISPPPHRKPASEYCIAAASSKTGCNGPRPESYSRPPAGIYPWLEPPSFRSTLVRFLPFLFFSFLNRSFFRPSASFACLQLAPWHYDRFIPSILLILYFPFNSPAGISQRIGVLSLAKIG